MTDAKENERKVRIDKKYKSLAEWESDLSNPDIYPPGSEAFVDDTGCYVILPTSD